VQLRAHRQLRGCVAPAGCPHPACDGSIEGPRGRRIRRRHRGRQ
jgi:hypothetical protein